MKKAFALILIIGSFSYWWLEKNPTRPKSPTPKNLTVEKKTAKKTSKKTTSSREKKQQAPSKQETKESVKIKQQAFDEHSLSDQGHLKISQILVADDYALAHGDIIVGTYDEVIEMERQGKLPEISPPQKWQGGIIPYTISRDYPNPERIERVLNYIQENSPVRFVEAQEQDQNYVRFELGEEHCFSALGQQGGVQKVILRPSCYEREIAHEVMHTLGFLHEQNRKDRDQYLKVHWDNIQEDYTEQFKKIPKGIIPIETTEFDFMSTMLYPSFAFSLSPSLPTMTTHDGQIYQTGQNWLSEGDLEKIKTFYSRD